MCAGCQTGGGMYLPRLFLAARRGEQERSGALKLHMLAAAVNGDSLPGASRFAVLLEAFSNQILGLFKI